ncbi:type III secretion system cytoplasmic ring protein SctQ [Trinickia sp.]|uniref:type III secretion system cytoplasmic ring protein SctQ n=1 Tax=Trinickia sp. TaxID=2571163 RepID=UPI003F7ED512
MKPKNVQVERDALPVALRRISTIEKVRHRLTRPHRAQCLLPDGGVAELLLRVDEAPPGDLTRPLPLSTRFGPAMALDYGPLLLACTGIDVDGSPRSASHRALARYAFAALAPALHAALGDPVVCDTPGPTSDRTPFIALHLRLALPSIRVAMRWRMTAEGIGALLDSGPWSRVEAPRSLPVWTAALKAPVPLTAGSATLTFAEYGALECGAIVCPSAASFDVTGRAVVRVASSRMVIRWLTTHHCFEVEDMSEHVPSAPDGLDAVVRRDGPPIDTTDIPVRLTFSLGALSLTVGDLAALARGSLLALERGLPPAVTIEANGLPVGMGELVDLDGRLAVEITHWPQGGARPPTP